jgi:hypothetical protein
VLNGQKMLSADRKAFSVSMGRACDFPPFYESIRRRGKIAASGNFVRLNNDTLPGD